MKLFVALLLLFACLTAHAATITIACVPAVKYTDGTSILAGTVSAFKFFGASQGQPKVLITPTAVSACSFIWAVTNPGTYCAEVSQVTQGTESDHSAEACLTIAQPKPTAPGAPTMTLTALSPTAFSMIKGQDSLIVLPVGTVSLTTPCDASQALMLKGQTYNPVPVASVRFTGTARPILALAICG